jgi:hypothetical protein
MFPLQLCRVGYPVAISPAICDDNIQAEGMNGVRRATLAVFLAVSVKSPDAGRLAQQ